MATERGKLKMSVLFFVLKIGFLGCKKKQKIHIKRKKITKWFSIVGPRFNEDVGSGPPSINPESVVFTFFFFF